MKKLTITLRVPDDFDTGSIAINLSGSDGVIVPPNNDRPVFRMEIGEITVTQTAEMPTS